MNTFPFVLPYAPKMLALIFVVAIYVVIAQRMWRWREPHARLEPIAETVGVAT